MGLWGLFGKGPMSQQKIDKAAKLAANSYAQTDVRMREMHRLISEGTPAALKGALKRFSVNASGHIADEEEKLWLEDALVDFGEDALEPLGEFIASGSSLTYALRSYRRIAGDERAMGHFIEVLERYGPDDHRSLEAKLQLIWLLGEKLDDPRIMPALRPFLVDHSDDVRWAVMELLEKAIAGGHVSSDVQELARVDLGALVTEEEVGPRIQRRAAEILAAQEWAVATEAEGLTSLLDEDYFLDKKKFVRRRSRGR